MSTVPLSRPAALPHAYYRRQGADVPNLAERDAHATVLALLDLSVLAGASCSICGAAPCRRRDECEVSREARCILAARNLTRDLVDQAADEPARHRLFGVLDVLDHWLDGCTSGEVRAQWRRIAEQVAS